MSDTVQRMTCPDCGRPGVALTKTGHLHQHNDQDKTNRLWGRTGSRMDRVLCEGRLLRPEVLAGLRAKSEGVKP